MTDGFAVVPDIEVVRKTCAQARDAGKTVALVPTMGALHKGHLALVDRAGQLGDFVVVSIFVNPAQFGPNEDLAEYPRDLGGDVDKLRARGVDLVMTPTEKSVYPQGHATWIHVDSLTQGLCGAHRPNHFTGVATVVAKLFNIVGPCRAVFGRKDFQQLQVIKRMAADLNIPVEIVGIPTVRDPDGLAASSRNVYLSAQDRVRALSLSKGLALAHRLFGAGSRRAGALHRAVLDTLETRVDAVDYVAVADPDTLELLAPDAPLGSRVLIAVAARVGSTRLIDNTVLGEDEPPMPL